MPSRKVWVFNPDSGGIKIPDSVKSDVERRVNSVAEQHFKVTVSIRVGEF